MQTKIWFDEERGFWVAQTPELEIYWETETEANMFLGEYQADRTACFNKHLPPRDERPLEELLDDCIPF